MASKLTDQAAVQSTGSEAAEFGAVPVLRSSCDACSLCKIKCDKIRPQCGRCQAASMHCVYGISRKHGKSRIGKQHRRHQSGSTISHPASNSSTSVERGGNSCVSGEGISGGDIVDLISAPSPSTAVESRAFQGSLPQDLRQSSTANSALDFADSLHADVMDLSGTTSNDRQHYGSFDMDVLGSNEPGGLSYLNSPKNMPFSQFLISPRASFAQYGRHNAGFGGESRSEHGSLPAHSCYTLAKSTLDDLHCDLDHGKGSTSSGTLDLTPPLTSSTSISSLSFDRVLCKTRSAVRNANQLRRCKCSNDPYLALLSAAILSKALVWYQVLAGMKRPMVSVESPSELSRHEARSPDFARFPHAIGDFDLEQEDRESLARQLLLKEVQKLSSILDTFSNSERESLAGRDLGDEHNQFLDERTSGLYLMLGTWLKTEMTRTIREIRGNQKHDDFST